jgi:hypothetical protein
VRGGGFSQHSVDQLIRALLRTGQVATPEEVAWLIERMATAPFNPAVVPIAPHHRGLTYQGQRLGAHADSLTYHLIQRVVIEGQWTAGTTGGQYLEDLRRAFIAPSARLAVYPRRGDTIAATVTPTADAVPLERRTLKSLPDLLVIYSANWGTILSGYQISGVERTGIPQEAKWLR